MREPCRQLRDDLFLYAEEELHGAAAVRHVERHLGACADCRELLDRHDRLTRAILQGGTSRSGLPDVPDSIDVPGAILSDGEGMSDGGGIPGGAGRAAAEAARRVDAAMERIRFAPPPEWLVAIRAGEAAGRARAVLSARAPGGMDGGGPAGCRDRRLLAATLTGRPPRAGSRARASGLSAGVERRWRLVAALLLLGSLGSAALLAFAPRWRADRTLAHRAAEVPELENGAPAGAVLALAGAQPGALAVATAAGSRTPEVWWILDEDLRQGEDADGDVRPGASSEFPALLHGFQLPAGPAAVRAGPPAASRTSVRAEVYLAGAGAPGPARWGERLFLVPTGPSADAGGFAFEICRVLSLREAAAVGDGAPAVLARWRQGSVRQPRLYRVYAGYGARMLSDAGPGVQFLVPAGGPALFPGLGLGAERRQAFPAASTWR